MKTIDVDKAWDKLHARLKEENLLVPESKKIPFIVKMQRIAAVIALCIFGGGIALYFNQIKENEKLVSIYNDDNSNTLVSSLNDGSIVYLASGTFISYPERFAADKRQVSLNGEAQFNVKSDKNCPFLVETEIALVEVTGTEFNVKATGMESFELYVLHGSVTVTLKSDGIPVAVECGEMVSLLDERLLKTMLVSNQTNYTEKMQFKDDRLDNIIKVINTLSDKPVVFADSTLKSREMTITFSHNTVIEMIELLCLGLDLKYTDDENEIVISN